MQTAWVDSLATVLTSAAAAVAVVTFVVSVRDRSREQAALVFSERVGSSILRPGDDLTTFTDGDGEQAALHVDPGVAEPTQGSAMVVIAEARRMEVVVHNESTHVISDLQLQVHDPFRGTLLAEAGRAWLKPRARMRVSLCYLPERPEDAGQFRDSVTTIRFTDGSGRRWRRAGSEPVVRVHRRAGVTPPQDSAWISAGRLPDGHEIRLAANALPETISAAKALIARSRTLEEARDERRVD